MQRRRRELVQWERDHSNGRIHPNGQSVSVLPAGTAVKRTLLDDDLPDASQANESDGWAELSDAVAWQNQHTEQDPLPYTVFVVRGESWNLI